MKYQKQQKLKLSSIILLFILFPTVLVAAPLDTWHQNFLLKASLFDSISSSPSGMFWDEVSCNGLFNGRTDSLISNEYSDFLHVDAAVGGEFGNVHFEDGSQKALSSDVKIDVNYKNFFVRLVGDIDSRYNKNNHYFKWKTDRGAAGRIAEAYLQLNHDFGFFRFGRLNRNWGPFFDRSLILSSNPHPYEGVEWQLFGIFFEFRHLFSIFPYGQSHFDVKDSTGTGFNLQRYLTAHSLNIMIKDWLVFGVTETVLFGRSEGFPDLQYINPFSIYTVINTNEEGDGNLFLSLHWKLYPFTKDIVIKGQIVIDDLQVDNNDISDKEPNHWGGDFEITWKDMTRIPFSHALTLQYTYLSRWLYLVSKRNAALGQRYTFFEKCLGYKRNDGDRWGIRFDIIGHDWWMAQIGVAYGRNGGNTVTSEWNTDESWNGYRKETILRSASSERVLELNAGFSVFKHPYADIHIGLQNLWIKNENNIQTLSFHYEPLYHVHVSVHYPNLFFPFSGKK